MKDRKKWKEGRDVGKARPLNYRKFCVAKIGGFFSTRKKVTASPCGAKMKNGRRGEKIECAEGRGEEDFVKGAKNGRIVRF